MRSKILYFVSVILVLFTVTGCGSSSSSDDDNGGDNNNSTPNYFSALEQIPVGQSRLLDIPTYDGKNQVVHPDILLDDGTFYMAITPYPWSNVDHENPCFYESKDGLNFVQRGHNPIVDHPKNGYNDDPDLIIDPITKEYRIYYNETPSDYKTQYIAVLRSKDKGGTWIDHRKLLRFNTAGSEPFIVSPALVYNSYVSKYFMYHVEVDRDSVAHSPVMCKKDPHKHYIKVLTSNDGIGWDKKNIAGIGIDYPAGFHPWHINVIKGNNDTYYMLINGYNTGFCDHHFLYIAVSHDLSNWHFIPTPVVTSRDAVMPNIRVIYRSAALINGDDMYIYFSFFTDDSRWMLGVKHIKISQYVK